jgi:NADH-quinone oxidoreductase subunit M
VFLLLLIGFAVKAPVFPFHTWLPVIAMEGPAAITALLTGLKLGAYGILRFAVPLAPQAASELHWLLAGLGVVGILYGALAALAQTNLRRMLAYSSISHVGLVILGISAFNTQGAQGALFLLLNFTVVAGGLFLLTAFLHHRVGSTEAVSLGGAAQSMPLLASFYLLLGLAGMGVPLTSGFPAEHLIVIGTLQLHLGAGLAALFGAVLTAAYFLGLYRRTFLGPMSSPVIAAAVDLQPRELGLAGVLALLVLLAGLYPGAVLEVTRTATDAWVARVGP